MGQTIYFIFSFSQHYQLIMQYYISDYLIVPFLSLSFEGVCNILIMNLLITTISHPSCTGTNFKQLCLNVSQQTHMLIQTSANLLIVCLFFVPQVHTFHLLFSKFFILLFISKVKLTSFFKKPSVTLA